MNILLSDTFLQANFEKTYLKNTLLVPAFRTHTVQVEESLKKETTESFNAKLTHEIDEMVGPGVYTQKVLHKMINCLIMC